MRNFLNSCILDSEQGGGSRDLIQHIAKYFVLSHYRAFLLIFIHFNVLEMQRIYLFYRCRTGIGGSDLIQHTISQNKSHIYLLCIFLLFVFVSVYQRCEKKLLVTQTQNKRWEWSQSTHKPKNSYFSSYFCISTVSFYL